jgi:hypothetical protein
MADKKGSSGEKTLYCSFCGKSQHEVKKLIAGPSVFICDECIELCNDIIRDEVPAVAEVARHASDLPVPSEIKASLDQYVIGQDPAKRTLAVAVYNHYKRLKHMGAKPRTRSSSPRATSCSSARPVPARRCWRRHWRAAERALRHRRCHHADRSRLRGRGRREHHPEAAAELQLRRRAGAARHRLHRRDRQDFPQGRQPQSSRATCRAKACSRRC